MPSSIARVLVVIFSLIGLGLEARTVFSNPNEWLNVGRAWNVLQPAGRIAVAAVFVVPICFYTFCLTTCFVRLRKRVLLVCVALFALVSLPVFYAISQTTPIVASNAAWTSWWWAFVIVEQLYAKRDDTGQESPATDEADARLS
jgi:hypothetical protein